MSVADEVSMGEPTPESKRVEDDVDVALSESEVDEVLAKRDLDQAAAAFDLQAWIEGVRSARTTVRLYARPDLDEQIQVVAAQLMEAMSLGVTSRVRELEAQIKTLKRQYFAASIDVVLEERSKEWQSKRMGELRKADVSGDRALTLELIASQIVEPADSFTGGDLARLAEVIPKQVNSLVEAWRQLSGADKKGLPVF